MRRHCWASSRPVQGRYRPAPLPALDPMLEEFEAENPRGLRDIPRRLPWSEDHAKTASGLATLSARAEGFGDVTEGRSLGIAHLLASETHKGTFSRGLRHFLTDA